MILCTASASAEERFIQELRVEASAEGWTIEFVFQDRFRLVGDVTPSQSDFVAVAVEPLLASFELGSRIALPEIPLLPSDGPDFLEEIRLERGVGNRLDLSLRFSKRVRVEMRAGTDFRSLRLQLRDDVPTPVADDSRSSLSVEKIDEMMGEAHGAMVAQEYDRAIAIYTAVLHVPAQDSGPYARDALEYLGLARQRNGQLAHARAEYVAYLERYPDGPGAERVAQRLAALQTARATAPQGLEPARRSERPARFDVYGSLYTAYFRTESFADLSGAELTDSSQLIDGDITARYRSSDLEVRGRLAGYMRYDFKENEVDTPSRVTRLLLEARDRRHRVGGILGRQSSRGAGVLGRFDGLTLDWGVTDQWALHAVAGFPLNSSVTNSIDTDHQVYGMSVEATRLFGVFDVELYGVGGRIDGHTDRIAIGTELRYVDDVRSAFGIVDYDAYFNDLNIAMFSGSWRLTDATTLRLVADYRNSPMLTSRSALIGQGVADLDALDDLFSEGEIKRLAENRTARVTTLTTGATHRLTPKLEVSGDFTATKIDGTDASPGIPGFPGRDWEFIYSAQLMTWDWLVRGGSDRLVLRIYDGERWNGYRIGLNGRYPLPANFRLTPGLRFEYRDNIEVQDYVELVPAVRVEYRFRQLTLDAEGGLQWLWGVGSGVAQSRSDEFGYVFSVGARYDF